MKTSILLLALVSTCALADNADTCAGYNFKPGTEAFGNCMMQLDQQAAQLDMQRRAAMMQMYRPINIQPSTYNYQMPTNQYQRQQTNCRWIGNVWNCQ